MTAEHLTPLTVAIYSAMYRDVNPAVIVADHLAAAWRTDIAVLPTLPAMHSSSGLYWVLFDLNARDHTNDFEERAVYIARPPANAT